MGAGAIVADDCSGGTDAGVVGSIIVGVADGCKTWVVCTGLTCSDSKDGSGARFADDTGAGAGPTDDTGAGSKDDSGTTVIG